MHRSDSLYIGIVFTMFVLSVAGFALLGPSAMTGIEDEPATLTTPPSYNYDVSGERYTVSADEFYTLCPGTDCILPLSEEQTQYESVDDADEWLESSDMVISLEVNGDRVAYPLSIMQHHFIVNTERQGTPLVVTYAPHAGYATAFSRHVQTDDSTQEVTFSFTGKLLYGDVIMQDETGTLWNPYHGNAIYGERVPASLQRIDTSIVRWSLWKHTHPNGSVISRNTGIYNVSRYEDDPYFTYRTSESTPAPGSNSDVLHPKDIVYGVTDNDETQAYREVTIKDSELVQDTVGTLPVIIVQDEETGYIHGFDRRINGSTLEFRLAADGTRMQSEDGTTWTLEGRAVDGPLQGETLDTLRLTRMYWFSWEHFNPDTELYQP